MLSLVEWHAMLSGLVEMGWREEGIAEGQATRSQKNGNPYRPPEDGIDLGVDE